MEIVINKRVGGFSLSFEQMEIFIKRKNVEFFIYSNPPNESILKYKKYNIDEIDNINRDFFITTTDHGDVTCYDDIKDVFSEYNIDRNDLDLIDIVKENNCANLSVIEIPDGVKWKIEEDEMGSERVVEEHRSWE